MPTTPPPTRLPEPAGARWTALRAGIQNVWEYDDRRFVFTRGRLLLRGQNEAGKTKALELLFPFLLDADLSPQRLDPFGTAARPMRWNLIGDADSDQMRVGYVWLELGRMKDGAPEYVTLGAGLKARRSAPDVESWFFLTGRRPDRDLHLVHEGRPLARGALEDALGEDGQVFERDAAGYRRTVNAKLFELEDEQYAALVDTLLHLRRPQLSKTLEPAQLSGFLTDALPPLDARVVGPIAEGFERLDHHRAELENLVDTLKKLQDFARAYRDYARSVARERAESLTRAESAFGRARGEERERAADRDQLEGRAAEVEREIEAQERREREAAARIAAFQDSDAFRAARDLDEAEESARRAGRHAGEVAARAGRDARDLETATALRRVREEEAAERGASAAEALASAETAARDASLGGPHAAVAAAAGKGDAAVAEASLSAIRAAREEAVARLRALHAELERKEEQRRIADARAREHAEGREEAREALLTAERAAADAWETWAEEVDGWREGLREIPGTSLPELEAGAPEAEPAALLLRVEEISAPIRQEIADAAGRVRAEQGELEDRRAAIQADRDALAEARHPLPPAPAWRAVRPADRAGAPLYELCEFGPAAAGKESGIEAALEASGLLDAWVESDGTVLDPVTGDVVLRGGAAPGRTLADVLAPVAAGGVTSERAREALARIGLAGAGEAGEGACWIGEDGRFQIGPLEGAHRKEAPAYVGATARERERERRLAELDALLREMEHRLAAGASDLERLGARAARLSAELSAYPRGVDVAARRADALARATLLDGARARAEESERRAVQAEEAASEASARLDRTAAELSVAAFARDPGRLAEASSVYFARAAVLVGAVRALVRAEAERERATLDAARVRERAVASGTEEREAAAAAGEAGVHAAALREAVGGARDELLAKLSRERAEREAAHAAARRAEMERLDVHERLGSARTAALAAAAEATRVDEARKAAAEGYRALGAAGVLGAAGFPLTGAPGEWSYTAALEHARSIGGAEAVPEEAARAGSERERIEDRLMRRHGDLALQLPPGVRIIPSRAAEVLSYHVVWNGHTRPVGEVVVEIEQDVAARNALLGGEESRLIERFLTGEAHDHLALRLRSASALVDRMNAALEPRTSAGGTQVRLQWILDEAGGVHADVHDAVPLFFKGGALLSEANRRTLREFLEQRLAQAREADDGRSLQERLAAVLDYRRWYRFEVQHRDPGQGWARLTRKAHGAGSGGKKAVMLHLPLFAAVAAFYDAAAPGAPRLVGLDEAFAGIDRPTRASLMGLLAEFDLDFLMTSFEEWGCYPQLDGLSTYHLTREPGHRGVFAEWFLWDGHERTMVEAS